MITVEDIVKRLLDLGYPVEVIKTRKLELGDLETLPAIYVGYNNIENRSVDHGIALDVYNLQGENLTQSFTIHLVSTIEDYPTLWKDVFKQLIGFNPILEESLHTSLNYVGGGVMEIDRTTMYWADAWRIGFPTNSLL